MYVTWLFLFFLEITKNWQSLFWILHLKYKFPLNSLPIINILCILNMGIRLFFKVALGDSSDIATWPWFKITSRYSKTCNIVPTNLSFQCVHLINQTKLPKPPNHLEKTKKKTTLDITAINHPAPIINPDTNHPRMTQRYDPQETPTQFRSSAKCTLPSFQ